MVPVAATMAASRVDRDASAALWAARGAREPAAHARDVEDVAALQEEHLVARVARVEAYGARAVERATEPRAAQLLGVVHRARRARQLGRDHNQIAAMPRRPAGAREDRAADAVAGVRRGKARIAPVHGLRHRGQTGRATVEERLPHLLDALIAPRLSAAVAVAEDQLACRLRASMDGARSSRWPPMSRSAEARRQVKVVDVVFVWHRAEAIFSQA